MTSRRSSIVISGPASNEKSTNVRVVIRIRPENANESQSGSRNIIEVLDDNILVFDPKEQTSPQFYHGRRVRRRNILVRKNKDLRFGFDRVFDKNATQQDVYESTTKPVIDGLMNGYNCSVFAYGATGAGKTFTMLGGGPSCPGVIFLTMMELYNRIEQVQSEKVCDVAVSYLEIYNETIRDLLVPSGALAVREDPQKGVCVNGLSVHKPQSAEELFSMLQFGNKNRTQHPTDANAESSRSHAVFQVFVRQKSRTANLNTDVKMAKMSLIDLAGSERALVTRNRGARFQEGANINKSLLALGSCINALASNKKDQFVPYRNSKLTRLLKDSLGGNCNTVMIAAVSPSSLTYDDTYNTLRYADRAKNIKSQVKSNVVNVNFHITQYTKIISDLRLEVTELKEKLSKESSNSNKNSNKETRVCTTTTEQNHEGIIKYDHILYDIFSQRASIRKELMELESSDRDLSWKISRKNLTIERLRLVYGNQVQGEKTMSKFQRTVAASEARHARVRKRKIDVDNRMEKNEQLLQNTAIEMASIGKGGKIPEVLKLTLRTRHLEIEVKDLRRQVKHLTKFARQQDSHMQSSERLISTLLSTVRKQFYLLKGSNIATSDTVAEFENIQKLVEGDREVLWADQNTREQDSTCDMNSLLELPVLNCVKTTPEAPATMSDTYVIVKPVAGKDDSLTPRRPSASDRPSTVARSLRSSMSTNSNSTPQLASHIDHTTTQNNISQSALPDRPHSQTTVINRRRTLTSEPDTVIGTPHGKSVVLGTPMRVGTPHRQSTTLGTPMRVPTPNIENQKLSNTYTKDGRHHSSGEGLDSVHANSPVKNSSFTIDGVCPLEPSPLHKNSLNTNCVESVGDRNDLDNKTLSQNIDLKDESDNTTVLTYAKVASTPKRQTVTSSRAPLMDIINSPRQHVSLSKTKPFQQKPRTRRFMVDKASAMSNKNTDTVHSHRLPSMSDRIQGKKRPAPAYMMMTTAAKNKRANNYHTRSSSEHRTPFAALPSRVRNSRAAPSRNVPMVRTKSMNSFRSTWQL